MAGSADDIQTYREMLKLDPRSRVFALLAEELCAAGEWEQVAQVCKEGLAFHPDHLRSRVLLGWAFMEMGEVDQSERILLDAVEDIRKNAIIFKLLSEFAIFSGNPESAAEYAKIYEAFQSPGAVEAAPTQQEHPEPAPTPGKAASGWDEFKAEAIEELQGTELDVVSAKMSSKSGVEEILTHLSQKIEERLCAEAAPAAILSEQDKSFLKQEIIAALSSG
jgi:hypothetical protein